MNIRTFIAIELTPEIQSRLAIIQDKLKKSGADVKWVKSKNIHLTLKFLGQVPEPQLKDIFGATDGAIEGIAPFPITFSGLGAFPKIDNPRVVWVGAKDGEDILSRINRNLEKNLEQTGFPREKREYHPHLTLGRVKSSKNKKLLVESVKLERNCLAGSMEVKEVTVMQSILHPEGPEYRPLYHGKLQAPPISPL